MMRHDHKQLREALETIDRLIMGEENVARETGRPLDASFRVAGMRAARDVVARLTEDAGYYEALDALRAALAKSSDQ